MTPCILVHSSQRFKEIYSLYLHGRSVSSSQNSVIVCHTPRSHIAEEHEILNPQTLRLTTVYFIIDELTLRKTSVLAYTKALSYTTSILVLCRAVKRLATVHDP